MENCGGGSISITKIELDWRLFCTRRGREEEREGESKKGKKGREGNRGRGVA
jgi:hypothetical protein